MVNIFLKKLEKSTAITYVSEYAKKQTHQYFNVPTIPEYIIPNGNPISTIILSIKKLFLFWEPNVPDRADFAASKIISIIRFMEVFEYICVLISGLYAISKKNFNKCDRIIIVLIIIGFWVVHTAAYIIPRYRDPITPIFIVLASITIVESYTRLLAHAEN